MARSITVYKKSDLNLVKSPPENVNSVKFDDWCKEIRVRCLYDEPLGSEGSIREFWSHPAEEIGLPMIADIYERGFSEGIEWSDDQLNQVKQELLHLKKYWLTLSFDKDLLDDLEMRSTYLQTAITIAQKNDGIVNIS